MGSRGPLPKSARTLSLHGSRPAAAHDGGGPTPTPTLERPEPPEALEGAAREVWSAVCDHLGELGVLDTGDAPALSLYATTYAEWLACAAYVREHGAMEEVRRRGEIVRRERPEAKRARQLTAELRQWAPLFALTPASRARLGLRAAPPRPKPSNQTPGAEGIRARIFDPK